MNHSVKFVSTAILLLALMLWGMVATALAQSVGGNSPTAAIPTDQFQSPTPVMTFLDMHTGQPWGRYVISETVTVPKYEYREVKERVWLPTWVQEPRNSTVTQYDPIVSYQLMPRTVPNWNPFSSPQQVLEYAPIVQYQPRNVQVNQMTTYQKYEEREVTRMVPVLVNASEQRARFVDRPLSAASGDPMASNLVQDAAMIAQANRTAARYPTRSIDQPSATGYGSPVYGSQPSTVAWASSQTLIPPPMPASRNPSATYASQPSPNQFAMQTAAMPPSQFAAQTAVAMVPNQIPVGNGVTYTSTMVPVVSGGTSPAGGLVASAPAPFPNANQPWPNSVAPQYAGAPAYGSNVPAGMPTYTGAPPYPGAYTGAPASSGYPPYLAWLSSTGTLFSTNLFQSRPASTMSVPGAPPVPYTAAYASNAPNFLGRTSPTSLPPGFGSYYPSNVTTASAPASAYRDPMQSGLPPTVMR